MKALGELYDVPIDYLLDEHDERPQVRQEVKKDREKRTGMIRRIALTAAIVLLLVVLLGSTLRRSGKGEDDLPEFSIDDLKETDG